MNDIKLITTTATTLPAIVGTGVELEEEDAPALGDIVLVGTGVKLEDNKPVIGDDYITTCVYCIYNPMVSFDLRC